MKKCPFCEEEIQDYDIKCRYCKQFLNEKFDSTEDNEIIKDFDSEIFKTDDILDKLISNKEFDGIISYIKEKNQDTQKIAENLYQSGIKATEKNDIILAIKLYEEALKHGTKAEIYSNLAWCQKEIGNFNKAIDYYHKILEEFPQHILVHIRLALIYAYNISNEKSLEEYNKFIDKGGNPNDVISLIKRGEKGGTELKNLLNRKNAGPEGLGGWLTVLCILIVISSAICLFTINSYGIDLINNGTVALLGDSNSPYYIEGFSNLMVFEILGNFILLIFCIVLIHLFFSKNKHFPKVFIIFAIYKLVLVTVDTIWALSLTELVELAQEAGEDMTDNGGIVGSAFFLFIWGSYIWHSKRVKNTFVKDTYNPEPLGVVLLLILIGGAVFSISRIQWDNIYFNPNSPIYKGMNLR